jgi:hypothetical protein
MFRIERGCLADYFGKPLREREDPILSQPVPRRLLVLLEELQRRKSETLSTTRLPSHGPEPRKGVWATNQLKKLSDEAGGRISPKNRTDWLSV